MSKSLEFTSGPKTHLYPRCTVRSIHRKLDGDMIGMVGMVLTLLEFKSCFKFSKELDVGAKLEGCHV